MNYDNKFKVLVTGFDSNYTSTVVNDLSLITWPVNVELIVKNLRFSFKSIQKEVDNVWKNLKPDLAIYLSSEIGESSICFEKCAFNKGFRFPDLDGFSPPESLVVLKGKGRLETKLDLKRLCERIELIRNPLLKPAISKHPGDFIPGYLYYLSLSQNSSKSLLILVPSKSKFKHLELEFAIKAIVLDALNQIYKVKF